MERVAAMDSVALCELVRCGCAEELAQVLSALGTDDARRLVQHRPRHGPHKGMHAMLVAARHNESVAVMQLLLEAASFDRSGLLLALHMAEKNNNAAVAQVLARAERTLTDNGSHSSACSEPAVHEGLSKKSFRTYSKLYRDPATFEVLEAEVLWELGKWALQRSTGRSEAIEAWSCGCSAGEEVFSVLASWEQAVQPRLVRHETDVELRFLGTDLSAEAIAAARRAEYSSHAVQDVPRATLQQCFQKATLEEIVSTGLPLTTQQRLCKDSLYRVTDRLKRQATFLQQDVRQELPKRTEASRFDLVLCRYAVFLYCSKDECAQFLRQLVEKLLRPGGFLVIGAPDELPSCWRALGLKEWRGYRGIFRLGDDPPPCHKFTSAYPQFSKNSLDEYIGKRRPADERIGCQTREEEPKVQTEEQIKERLVRFKQWEEAKQVHVKQLQADRDKEEAGIKKRVFLSDSEHEQFVSRMQSEATRREEALQKMQAEVEKKSKKRQAKRKPKGKQRSLKSVGGDAAILHAKAQTEKWLERRNRAPSRAPAFGGRARSASQTRATGRTRDDSDSTLHRHVKSKSASQMPTEHRPRSGGSVAARTRPASRAEMLMHVRHEQMQNKTAPAHQQQRQQNLPERTERTEKPEISNPEADLKQNDLAKNVQEQKQEREEEEEEEEPSDAWAEKRREQVDPSCQEEAENYAQFSYSLKFIGWKKLQAMIVRRSDTETEQHSSPSAFEDGVSDSFTAEEKGHLHHRPQHVQGHSRPYEIEQSEPLVHSQPYPQHGYPVATPVASPHPSAGLLSRPHSACVQKRQHQRHARFLRRPASAEFRTRRGPVSRGANRSSVHIVSLVETNRKDVVPRPYSAAKSYRQPRLR